MLVMGVEDAVDMNEEQPLTDWLRAADAGDQAAGDQAYAMIYDQLRDLAARQLRRNDAQATLSPTALVNEVFLRLSGGVLSTLNDRQHFFNLAARAMRNTVIDHARERLAAKRGGDLVRTELTDGIPDVGLDAQQVLAIDQALRALEVQDANLARTFNWRVFGGLSTERIAELRGVTERTIQRDLNMARGYLHVVLGGMS
jgi:RNA polymerase sigma factor (TIGR02999 family)